MHLKDVVASGCGHVPGMLANRGAEVDRQALSVIPLSGSLTKWLKRIIPITILAAFTFGYFRLSGETLEKMIWDWVIPNAFGAGILALLLVRNRYRSLLPLSLRLSHL